VIRAFRAIKQRVVFVRPAIMLTAEKLFLRKFFVLKKNKNIFRAR